MYMRIGGGLQVRGDGDEEVSKRNAGRGEVRRGASSGAQEGQRVSILQQIVETGAFSQGKQVLRAVCLRFAEEYFIRYFVPGEPVQELHPRSVPRRRRFDSRLGNPHDRHHDWTAVALWYLGRSQGSIVR